MMVARSRVGGLSRPWRDVPLSCAAGVTLFDPLRRYGATAGTRVAVIGLGGLGIMGVRIARALGCTVTGVSRTPSKAAITEAAGAAFIDSNSPAALAAAAASFDLVLNTIPVNHDYTVYSALATRAGKHVILGLNSALGAAMTGGSLLAGARVRGSAIGGIEATQAVVDLCAKHNIRPDVRVIPVEGINAAYEALDRNNDEGVRFVVDLAGSLNEGAFERCKGVPPPKLGPGTPLTMGAVMWTLAGMVFGRYAF